MADNGGTGEPLDVLVVYEHWLLNVFTQTPQPRAQNDANLRPVVAHLDRTRVAIFLYNCFHFI